MPLASSTPDARSRGSHGGSHVSPSFGWVGRPLSSPEVAPAFSVCANLLSSIQEEASKRSRKDPHWGVASGRCAVIGGAEPDGTPPAGGGPAPRGGSGLETKPGFIGKRGSGADGRRRNVRRWGLRTTGFRAREVAWPARRKPHVPSSPAPARTRNKGQEGREGERPTTDAHCYRKKLRPTGFM